MMKPRPHWGGGPLNPPATRGEVTVAVVPPRRSPSGSEAEGQVQSRDSYVAVPEASSSSTPLATMHYQLNATIDIQKRTVGEIKQIADRQLVTENTANILASEMRKVIDQLK